MYRIFLKIPINSENINLIKAEALLINNKLGQISILNNLYLISGYISDINEISIFDSLKITYPEIEIEIEEISQSD